MKNFTFLLLASLFVYACSEKKDDPTPDGSACQTTGVTYSGTVQPILQANCNGCHGASSNLNLTSLAQVQLIALNGKLYGTISHAQGFSPMPKNKAKLSDCDIAKIKTWIDAGAPAN